VAAIAQEVTDVLSEKGYRVLVQDYDIPLGASFIERMHEAIISSRDLIILFTEDYLHRAARAKRQYRSPRALRRNRCERLGRWRGSVARDGITPDAAERTVPLRLPSSFPKLGLPLLKFGLFFPNLCDRYCPGDRRSPFMIRLNVHRTPREASGADGDP
jgi:hypothetical protein